ncbi:hypothetical protein SAY87_027754 [Trapa incisa]|uniref:Uncharacterized protein n=1 Tax=Trapa incisa TaxID=236973 RepID=A0AAN7PR22_9MYRT|nr:hypothetical protein SAY87_027754 [Trapa incisa]
MTKDKKPRSPTCCPSFFGAPKLRGESSAGSQVSESDKWKSRRWLPLPRAWIQKSGSKTVPVDAPAALDKPAAAADVESEKAEARRRYNQSRSKSKLKLSGRGKSSEKPTSSKRRVQVAAPTAVPPAAPDQDNPLETNSTGVTTECRPDNLESDLQIPFQPHRGLSLCRKVETVWSGNGPSSQPGSPINRARIGPLTRSDSFRDLPLRKNPQQEGRGSLDPLVGMSVMMVILIIMVLWGKVCAILCTSTWLYAIPRMRLIGDKSDGSKNSGQDRPESDKLVGLDIGSEEYKKKVVLGGLLERNRRIPPREKGVNFS